MDDVRIPLVRLGAEEAVEALEAAAERPVLLRRRHVHLVLGAQVPLPDDVGVPATLAQHFGDQGGLARDVAARVGEPRRGFRDARHRVRGVVPAGQQARARRRAERGRVEVRVGEPLVGDALDVRRLDQAAKRLHRREAHVVEDDVQHAGRTLGRDWLRIWLPVGDRVLDVDVDRALEGLAHGRSPLLHRKSTHSWCDGDPSRGNTHQLPAILVRPAALCITRTG
jgi:hypothetical protein